MTTRGGSPNGSRRVARRAAATFSLNGGIRAGPVNGSGPTRPIGIEIEMIWQAVCGSLESNRNGNLNRNLNNLDCVEPVFSDRAWWWSRYFMGTSPGRRAEGGF